MIQNIIKKSIIVLVAALFISAFFAYESKAMTLDQNTVVYTTATGKNYHLIDNCGSTASPKARTLHDVLSSGIQMCATCAKNVGLDPDVASNLKLSDLPLNTPGDINSTTSSGSSASSNSSEEYVDASESSDSKSRSESSRTTQSNSSRTSSKSSSGNSSSNSSTKELMTEKQRRSKFLSKTNPKRGETPATIARPASVGFSYADFARYNSYNSDNKLGGTPIYLLGTIMDIQPVKQTGSEYGLAVMVNDCDGYQWYMRCKCDKSKYDLLKAELLGKAANIYGTYAGYSGVTNRPMLDINSVFEVGGNAVSMELYK